MFTLRTILFFTLTSLSTLANASVTQEIYRITRAACDNQICRLWSPSGAMHVLDCSWSTTSNSGSGSSSGSRLDTSSSSDSRTPPTSSISTSSPTTSMRMSLNLEAGTSGARSIPVSNEICKEIFIGVQGSNLKSPAEIVISEGSVKALNKFRN